MDLGFESLRDRQLLMNDVKKIFWIASYPKSGNTWLRLILCGLFFTEDGNLKNLNVLNEIPKFDKFKNFEFIKNISLIDYNKIFEASEYNEEAQLTLSKYWVEAQRKLNLSYSNYSFFKTHNARLKFKNFAYTNEETTLGFIYIVRDPRDVVISYSKWKNKNIDETIKFLMSNNIMGNQNTISKMPEFIFNWKDHYKSWKNFVKVPSIIIRYEDLLFDLEFEINRIIDFFYINYNIRIDNKNKKIKNIINSTNFKNLQNIESKKGFVEQSEHTVFFRSGEKNQWQYKLTENQQILIQKNFEKEMIQLKYI